MTTFLAPQPPQAPATREPPGAVHSWDTGRVLRVAWGGLRVRPRLRSTSRLSPGSVRPAERLPFRRFSYHRALRPGVLGLSPLCLTAASPRKEAASAFPQLLLVFQARRGGAPEPPLAGGLLLRRLQHLHARPEPVETGESPGSGREASDAGHPALPLSLSPGLHVAPWERQQEGRPAGLHRPACASPDGTRLTAQTATHLHAPL